MNDVKKCKADCIKNISGQHLLFQILVNCDLKGLL